MSIDRFVSADEIRSRFSRAMSDMYRDEVPQYGLLLDLVQAVNAETLSRDPALAEALSSRREMDRLPVERHGAIRLGTAEELSTMRRVFAVMGMYPVAYYDLSVAGVPVHSTAFRPVDAESLRINPFRVFTSLLRLELIADDTLRQQAQQILARRRIFSERALALVKFVETAGGLDDEHADEFVREVRETFRWHSEATVDAATYRRLHDAHRLIADVVCFKGPHINHLTPRTLDIDAAQVAMPKHGIGAKDVIEGPPPRRHPILLRQTSFKALEERIAFPDATGETVGTHTARFGEIEQRGIALTPTGRELYDRLLASVRDTGSTVESGSSYAVRLDQAFKAFPDDLETLRTQGLAFFRYAVKDEEALARSVADKRDWDLERLLQDGVIEAQPIIYEDFLPVSAAGIFQSNLGGSSHSGHELTAASAARAAFEVDLGAPVIDEMALYAEARQTSVDALKARFALS